MAADQGAATVLPYGVDEATYDRKRAELRETYGNDRKEAGIRYEQELAKLFAWSGWTQERLAKKEGKGQQRIGQLLRFGRFLNFTTACSNHQTLPDRFTEGRFRQYWESVPKTEGDERQRFAAVVELMKGGEPKKFVAELVKQFGDGKWHTLSAMHEFMQKSFPDATEEKVFNSVNRMCSPGAHYGRADRKQIGPDKAYRLFPRATKNHKEKMVSAKELAEKLKPIIEGLLIEGRKNEATASPPTVATLAGRLRKLLEEWTE